MFTNAQNVEKGHQMPCAQSVKMGTSLTVKIVIIVRDMEQTQMGIMNVTHVGMYMMKVAAMNKSTWIRPALIGVILLLFLLCMLAVTSCTTLPQELEQIISILPTWTPSPLPTATRHPQNTPTAGPTRTPTLDHQATAGAAQETAQASIQTAISANGLMLDATVAAMEFEKVSIEATQAYEEREHAEYMEELQLLPLRVTISANEKEISENMVQFAGIRATETAYAPIQKQEEFIAENQENLHLFKWVMAVSAIVIVALAFLFLLARTHTEAQRIYWKGKKDQREYTVYLREESKRFGHQNRQLDQYRTGITDWLAVVFKQGGRTWTSHALCTESALMEFANRMYLQSDCTLGINNWEGEHTEWTRDAWIQFREYFLKVNGLAYIDAQSNHWKLTSAGDHFCEVISRLQTPLPSPIFVQFPVHMPIPSEFAHMSKDHGGGEVVE